MARLAFTNRWAVLALLFLARVGTALQFQSVPPIAPLLVRALELNYTQIGLLVGLYMFAGIALALPSGLLARRFGDKAIVLSGLGLMTVGALVFAAAPSFAVAVLGRLLGGAGVVLLNVQLTKMTTDWFAESRLATAMGILMAAWPTGIALGFATLGFVAEAGGWRVAIAATGGASGAMWLVLALLYRDRPRSATATPAGPLWAIGRAELALVLVAGLVWMLPNVGFIVFLSFTPVLLVATGIPVAAAGSLLSLASWISIGSVPLGGWLTDRSGRVVVPIMVGTAGCAALSLLVAGGGPYALWIVSFGVVMGIWPGAVMVLPGRVLSPGSRSTGFGAFYTVYYLGMTTLVPVAGWLQDRLGSPHAALQFGALLWLATLVPLLALRLLQRRWAPAPQPVPEAAG